MLKEWFKKHPLLGTIIIAGILALVFGSGTDSGSSKTQAWDPAKVGSTNEVVDSVNSSSVVKDIPNSAPTYQQKAVPSSNTSTVQKSTNTNSGLSNDNYYINVDGNEVHSPAYSDSVPAGATAKCRDGTYSFSQHRSGTCSHHGGVAQWL